MSYGDSTTWNGTVPAASDVTYNVFWQVHFKGAGNPKSCDFQITTGDDEVGIAQKLTKAWNDQNPDGPLALRAAGHPNRKHRVEFLGVVVNGGMKFVTWKEESLKPPDLIPVLFAESTNFVENKNGRVTVLNI